MLAYKLFLLLFCFFRYVLNLQVILQRAGVTYVDTNYMEDVKAYVQRYSRRSPYYFNAYGVTKQTWTNNVTISLVFCEYLHNEYRPSFFHHHTRCDFLAKCPFIGSVLTYVSGLTCPLPAGGHTLSNLTWTIAAANFPNVFPIEEPRIQIQFWVTATKHVFFKGYLDAIFKNELTETTKKSYVPKNIN